MKLPPHSQMFEFSVEDFGDGSTPMARGYELLMPELGTGGFRNVS